MLNNKIIIVISACFLLAVTFLSFLPSLNNGFTNFDDDLYVTANKAITSISLPNIAGIFSSFQLGLYKPLVMLSFAAEYHFFKLNPFVYHLTNLILHLMNCLLVFWMAYLLSASSLVAVITALFFGIHPMHVESVAWVSERKDVLFSFFFFWAVICYLYHRKAGSRLWYYSSISAFILSLLSKPTGLILPFVLLAVDFLQRRKGWKEMLAEKAPFFALSAAFIIINIYGQLLDPNPRPREAIGFIDSFSTLSYCVLFYLKKIIWPLKLSCIYSYPQKSGGFYPALFYLSSLVVIPLTAWVFLLRERCRKLFFGLSFFLITLLPALGIVPIFVGMAADRYTYIPYIGIFFIFGEGIRGLYTGKRGNNILFKGVISAGLISLIGIFSFLTFNRTQAWRDSFTLWDNVLENYPKESYAYYSLGLVYLKENDLAKALAEFNKAVELRPAFLEARINRAVIYSRQGALDQALSEYSRIIKYSPRCFEAYNNRGNIYGKLGKLDQAIADFSAAIQINSRYSKAYYNRAVTYFLKKERKKGIEDLNKAGELGFSVQP